MAKKKSNQNTSYKTTSGQKVTIKNGVKTYSGGTPKQSGTPQSNASPQLKALSISLAKGAPVPNGVRDNSGRDVGGRVLSRPSPTLNPNVRAYSGEVQYSGDSLTSPRENNPGTATGAEGFNAGQPAPFQYTPNTTRSDTFYRSLLDSLRPSREENNVSSQQQALDAELRNTNQGQDEMNRNIKDQPIALPFITGQQNAVEERYALRRGDIGNRQQTLQAKLANLQARRQSAMDVAKVGLNYAQDQEGRAERSARQRYEDQLNNSRYSDSQSQQRYQNSTNESRYRDQQTQQQYENTINANQYLDKKTQQAIDNAMERAKFNKPTGGKSTRVSTQVIDANGKKLLINTQTGAVISDLGASSGSESKDIQAFTNDASGYVEKLGSNTVSWGTAFNSLKTKYPQASNELIDQTLGKDRYYTVRGQ